jgi:hypothetical protein
MQGITAVGTTVGHSRIGYSNAHVGPGNSSQLRKSIAKDMKKQYYSLVLHTPLLHATYFVPSKFLEGIRLIQDSFWIDDPAIDTCTYGTSRLSDGITFPFNSTRKSNRACSGVLTIDDEHFTFWMRHHVGS